MNWNNLWTLLVPTAIEKGVPTLFVCTEVIDLVSLDDAHVSRSNVDTSGVHSDIFDNIRC